MPDTNEMTQEERNRRNTELAVKFEFATSTNFLARYVHDMAVSKGFWADDRPEASSIALMHSELSEWLEAIREGNPQSEKIPDYSAAEEEAADLIIRVLDESARRGYRIGQAVVAKMNYNAGRPYKHGKEF